MISKIVKQFMQLLHCIVLVLLQSICILKEYFFDGNYCHVSYLLPKPFYSSSNTQTLKDLTYLPVLCQGSNQL